MATVHYENGKLHVHKEVLDLEKKTEKQNENLPSENKQVTSDHLSPEKDHTSENKLALINHPALSTTALCDRPQQGDYPPPRI